MQFSRLVDLAKMTNDVPLRLEASEWLDELHIRLEPLDFPDKEAIMAEILAVSDEMDVDYA